MYQKEITIPVNRDSRNFEQRRKDMFNTLERSITTHTVSNKSEGTHDKFGSNSDWDMEIQDWMRKSRNGWDDEISNIKRSMFSLEASDEDCKTLSSDNDSNTSRTISKQVTSTTTTISKDGKAITENAKTILPSSGGIVPQLSIEKSNYDHNALTGTDYFKDAYEVADNKLIYFKVRVDTADFKPEDIKIIAKDNQVTVTARKETISSKGTTLKEFSKTISVPPSVDISKFQCLQTKDGILSLEAPLKQQDNFAITLKDGIGIKAVSDQHSKFSNSLVTVMGKSGPIVIDDVIYGKKIHLEITVDHDYQPSDFSVYTQLNQIHIKGRHETKTANSSSFKEFSRYYEVPETLDPMSVSFHLLNGTLVVEAPLLKTV